MGATMARAIEMENRRIIMFGLDHAGKSTLLHRLKVGEVVATAPTIGFNVEDVEYRKHWFQVWDIGGQEAIRKGWRHNYYFDTDGLVFVVDSSDHDRLEVAREELYKALNEEEMRDAALLVVANKQDLPNAMTGDEIALRLGLYALKDRRWFVQESDALTGSGLAEGFSWLEKTTRHGNKILPHLPHGCDGLDDAMKRVHTSINDSITFSWLHKATRNAKVEGRSFSV
eukprot:TRINITY_DN4185_c0_g1_i1.p1 TRINITY_DN4185_c0_g1~~TRINITY_DN4185_c0_g1_i1.p1  ORF type:complete len:228 (-),score=51.02 TRINITY_DN4185_c0_g1_i1:288-971(-)